MPQIMAASCKTKTTRVFNIRHEKRHTFTLHSRNEKVVFVSEFYLLTNSIAPKVYIIIHVTNYGLCHCHGDRGPVNTMANFCSY